MRTKKQLVRTWRRPNRDGRSYAYYLRYTDLEGKDRCESLGHNNEKKAEKQRLKKEKELRMGYCGRGSMRLSEYMEQCLRRSGEQIRESTKIEYNHAMKNLIEVIGDIDFQKVEHHHGESYVMVPPERYDLIQNIRKGEKSARHKKVWKYEDSRINVVPSFSSEFKKIKAKAGIKINKTFHDIRRTAITNWFYAGLEINEVMRLAGHSKNETTMEYYLAVQDDLMSKARKAVKFRVDKEMLEKGVEK